MFFDTCYKFKYLEKEYINTVCIYTVSLKWAYFKTNMNGGENKLSVNEYSLVTFYDWLFFRKDH